MAPPPGLVGVRAAAENGALFSEEQWQAIALSLGLSAREFACRLGISSHTVHTHLGRLYRKLGVRNRCQLLVRVFEEYVNLQSSMAICDGALNEPTPKVY